MPVPLRVVQRRAAPAVADAGLRSRRDQERDDLAMPVARGEVKRGPVVIVLRQISQAVVIEHLPHALHIARRSCRSQLRRSLLRRHSELRAGVAKHLRDLLVVVAQRVVEGRPVPAVAPDHRCARLEQQLDYCHVALARRDVERRTLIIVAKVCQLPAVLLQEGPDCVLVVAPSGVHEQRASVSVVRLGAQLGERREVSGHRGVGLHAPGALKRRGYAHACGGVGKGRSFRD
mmetsp:Transcript_37132/g.120751  ORF Transcript_37132/g.120751 Transcript_37132/m.120751 type:complete len:232 (+) Transcript_37132:1188-1883(+)